MRIISSDPERVAKRIAGYTPEVKAKMSEQAKRRMENPEYRERLREASSRALEKIAADPEFPNKCRIQSQKQWAERKAKGLVGPLGTDY